MKENKPSGEKGAGKVNLLISFSGGRTSGMMTKWIMDNWKDKYEIIVVFANTGKENEATLEFVDKCDKAFGFNVVWIEAVPNPEFGIGTGFRIVDFNTANRTGKPFEDVIKKYGIPNKAYPHCSRELKQVPIKAYARSIGWSDYYTAIGIRVDEFDRMNKNRVELQLIYPLVHPLPTTKGDINAFWAKQPFDLELKSYEGNCDCCWKKTTRKLMTIGKENPSRFDWWQEMETKYEDYTPETRDNPMPPYRFFRQNISVTDILTMLKQPFKKARDESKDVIKKQLTLDDLDLSFGCTESCEPF